MNQKLYSWFTWNILKILQFGWIFEIYETFWNSEKFRDIKFVGFGDLGNFSNSGIFGIFWNSGNFLAIFESFWDSKIFGKLCNSKNFQIFCRFWEFLKIGDFLQFWKFSDFNGFLKTTLNFYQDSMKWVGLVHVLYNECIE